MSVKEISKNRAKLPVRNESGKAVRNARSGTFTDNMKLPVHRWFRYSAGFSAEWVCSEIERFEEDTGETAVVIDPFVGSGTTSFASCSLGKNSFGFDGHPFVARIAKAKNLWHLDEYDFKEACQLLMSDVDNASRVSQRYDSSPLLGKCYEREALDELDSLKYAFEKHADEDPIWELVRLNITSVLRACSNVGTAQWQYILPNKTKNKVLAAGDAFMAKADLMAADMEFAKCPGWTNTAVISETDVRHEVNAKKGNLILTSPPYPNNYAYPDATRPALTSLAAVGSSVAVKTAGRTHVVPFC